MVRSSCSLLFVACIPCDIHKNTNISEQPVQIHVLTVQRVRATYFKMAATLGTYYYGPSSTDWIMADPNNKKFKKWKSGCFSAQNPAYLCTMFFRKYLHNKYFYVGFAFLIWMIFFDQESLQDQMRLNRSLRNLEKQKEFYLNEIDQNNRSIDILTNDTAHLETFAREKYYMKKDNEDVFVIIRDKQE